MDRHDLEGVTAQDLAMAHVQDLEVQDKYGVRYLTYWFDYDQQQAFCLVEAPDAAVAQEVHGASHGLLPNRIIPVDPDTVQRFLGSVMDDKERWPEEGTNASALRTILFTDMEGSTELTQRFGDEASMELVRAHNEIVRSALAEVGGREVKHTGDGMMACFDSVARAIECAIKIQREVDALTEDEITANLKLRVGLSAGEPVEEEDDLFGSAVQMAARICDSADPGRIYVSNVVRELAIGKGFGFEDVGPLDLKGFPEPVLVAEVNWRAE